jgi:hypothetical protein
VVRIDGAIVGVLEQRMSGYKKPFFGRNIKKERQIANEDCNLLSTVARELFRVQNAAQILAQFSQSNRVKSDLQKARDAKRGSTIVLRKFQLCLPEG